MPKQMFGQTNLCPLGVDPVEATSDPQLLALFVRRRDQTVGDALG
jgi:hypothetical protein